MPGILQRKGEKNMKKDLSEAITNATKMLDHHDRMKNAFFFTPPKSASARRSYEKYHTLDIQFEYKGHTYAYESECECSCRNVYFTDGFRYDGKKTTATKIKNVLAKMEEEAESSKE